MLTLIYVLKRVYLSSLAIRCANPRLKARKPPDLAESPPITQDYNERNHQPVPVSGRQYAAYVGGSLGQGTCHHGVHVKVFELVNGALLQGPGYLSQRSLAQGNQRLAI